MKMCSTCGVPKSDQEFYERKSGRAKGYRLASCVECSRKESRQKATVKRAMRYGLSVEIYLRLRSSVSGRKELRRLLGVDVDTKVCCGCGDKKSMDDFHKRRNGSPLSCCKPCHGKMNADWNRAERLWTQYGITEKGYEELLGKQRGKCAICRRPPKENKLNIDHNHQSGKVRGLLCALCNSRLGWLEKHLTQITEYLHPESNVKLVGMA